MALNSKHALFPALALLAVLQPASAALSYTCDPNIDGTRAGTCEYLNSTIAALYNDRFSNISANIYVHYGNTDLGMSHYFRNFITYNQYLAALTTIAQSSGSSIQASAVKALNSIDTAVYGNYMVEITTPLGKAFGLSGLFGSTAAGNACSNPGTSTCFDGVITVSNSASLYYRQGTEAPDAYDFYSVVEHETDELLGTASCIDTGGPSLSNSCSSTGNSVLSAVNLFRYQSPGNLVLISGRPGAYFSYDGGQTNGTGTVQKLYNTLDNTEDYADFVPNDPCQLRQSIQDAEGCPGFDGGLDITNDGGAEINILTAVGFMSSAPKSATPTNLEVSDIAPPATGCTLPPAMTSFSLSNSTVYLYFNATVSNSDALSNDWLAPNATVVPGISWNTGVGTFCYTGSSLVIGNLPSAELGAWQARIYDNGTQIASTSFTVSSSASRPAIISVSPSTVFAGGAAFTLTVNGSGFASGATVVWNGTALSTTFVSSTQLTASVPSSLIAFTGSASITVSSGGQTSVTSTIMIAASSNLSRIGVLPQMAAGAGWDTAVYITNTSGVTVAVALLFYADNGSALSLPLNVTQQGMAQSTTTSVLNASIPPNTTLAVDTGTLGALAQGWVDVRASGVVTGFAVFRYGPQGLSGKPGVPTPWEGTVPLQTQLLPSAIIVPFDNTNGFSDGIALGNLSGAPAEYTAVFFDADGNALGAPQIISLGTDGHTAFLVNSQYLFTANISGIMKITGPALMGLGLRASPYGTLTAVPLPLQ